MTDCEATVLMERDSCWETETRGTSIACDPSWARSAVRVLVIDDNPDIHGDFRKILCARPADSSTLESAEAALFGATETRAQQEHFELDSAFQGEQGLARVHHAVQEGRPYTMAFVDVRMPPGWDGIEVTPRLWVAQPDLAIVICTAYADYSWEEMFERLGASDRLFILSKPFDRVEVLQIAHSLARRSKQALQDRLRIAHLDHAVQSQARALKELDVNFQTELARLGNSRPKD